MVLYFIKNFNASLRANRFVKCNHPLKFFMFNLHIKKITCILRTKKWRMRFCAERVARVSRPVFRL